ncbi:MAG: MFS transporter [Chloroflexota bacterium]
MNRAKSPRFFYGYTIALASFFSMVMMWGTYNTFGVFLPLLSAEFGWARAVTSGAFSLSTLLRGPLSFIAGWLTDRLGPKLVVAVSGLFLGAGYLLMSRVDSAWQMYLFYGLMIGIGMGASFIPLMTTTARWFIRGRGLMAGLVVCGGGLGILVWPLLAGWLITSYGWRSSYAIMGWASLVIITAAALLLKRDPAQAGLKAYGWSAEVAALSPVATNDISLREAISARPIWILSGAFFLAGVCMKAVVVHLAPYATDLGFSPAIAATTISVFGGVSIVGRIAMGVVADRLGNKLAMVANFVLLTVAMFWLYSARELWVLYLAASLYGLAHGGVYAVISPYLAELFGTGAHGAIFGATNFWHEMGGAIGAVLPGIIFDRYGAYGPAFLILAGFGLLTVVLAVLLRPTGHQPAAGLSA